MASNLGLAAYGSYAATPDNEAQIWARKFFPYQYLFGSGDQTQQAQQPQGLADGGVALDNTPIGSTESYSGGTNDAGLPPVYQTPIAASQSGFSPGEITRPISYASKLINTSGLGSTPIAGGGATVAGTDATSGILSGGANGMIAEGAADAAGTAAPLTLGAVASGLGGVAGGFGLGTMAGNMLNPGHQDQSMVGAGGGAATGAAIGSIVPGIGTVLGGILGGLFGGAGGSLFGPGKAHHGWGVDVGVGDNGQYDVTGQRADKFDNSQTVGQIQSQLDSLNSFDKANDLQPVSGQNAYLGGNNKDWYPGDLTNPTAFSSLRWNSATPATNDIVGGKSFSSMADLEAALHPGQTSASGGGGGGGSGYASADNYQALASGGSVAAPVNQFQFSIPQAGSYREGTAGAPLAGLQAVVANLTPSNSQAILPQAGTHPSLPGGGIGDIPMGVTSSLATAPSTTSVPATQAVPVTSNSPVASSGGGLGTAAATPTTAQPSTDDGLNLPLNINSQGGEGGGGGMAFGGRAGGGMMANLMHGSGPIHGASPGRGDGLQMRLPRGAYVLPADVVSSHGQGNTLAGAANISRSLHSLPKFARGGKVDPVTVAVSGGEYAIHPNHVAALGGGSLARGHALLDRFVHSERAKSARTEQSLPAPI